MSSLDPHPEHHRGSPRLGTMDALATSLAVLCASSLIVVLGAIFGLRYLASSRYPKSVETELVGSFAAWDGEHYVRIAQEGYSYDPDEMSNVAFFPAYPLAGRLIAALTGWRMEICLLMVSYAFLLAAFVAAALYVDRLLLSDSLPVLRSDGEGRDPRKSATMSFALLAFAFFPTTFYFRMAYTESLFVFEVILTLYAMKLRWPLWTLASVIGLATATRASGVALLVPLLWHLWDRSPTWTGFVVKSMLTVPAACWGLAAYMVFLYLTFGDPLAFAQTQKHWDRRPPIPLAEKLWLDVTLEPVVCVYKPSCRCYQIHGTSDPSPLFSMYFANPVYFLLFAALVAYGAIKGWLSREEVLTGAALLLLSYLSKGYATCMCSQARYASTAFPVYLVMGKLLQRIPGPVAAMTLIVCGFFLAVYSALFVRWYDFY